MFYMPRRVAKTDCFIMHFLYEGTPGAALHHPGGNIARSDYTVMEGRRGMHHERFIETRHIQRAGVAIACMNHRSRDRKRVVEGKSVSVRVYMGGRGYIKK